MTASLGRFKIVGMAWVGSMAVAVDVETELTGRHLQLYAGRQLIGVTDTAGQTRVVGQLAPAHCPHALTVLMVAESERLTNFGPRLPRRPYNQLQLAWQADSFPADAKWFEIAGSTVVDGDVDPDNVVSRVQFLGDGAYQFLLPPVDAPGLWKYRVTPRDDAEPAGNAGTAVDVERRLVPYPPDVVNDEGQRLTGSVAAGVLTVGFAFNF